MPTATTLDEFDVEFATNYSGSYNDNIMSGTMVSTGSLSLQNVARTREGSHSSGSTWMVQFAQSQTPVPFSSFYDHQLKYNVGYNYKFNFSNCVSEIYTDCVLPDIFNVVLTNGGKRVFQSSPESLTSALSGVFLGGAGAQNNAKVVLGYSDITVTASVGSIRVSDNAWLQTFPYQYRYQSVTRRVGFQTFTVATDYNENVVTVSGTKSDVTYSVPTVSITSDPAQIAIELLNIPITASQGNTSDGDWSGIQHTTLTEFYGKINASSLLLFTTSSYQYAQPFYIHKHFFGFGDGYRGQTLFERVTGSADSTATLAYRHGQGAIIRGWKYGIYSGVPTQSRAVWRRNRFGHFRDMLEQRLFTKFYNPLGLRLDGTMGGDVGNTFSVVQVKFLSGSEASVTASLSSSLNTRESGIFDFEYKSNRPFFDI